MLAGGGPDHGPPRRAGVYGMANFDADTLHELRDVRELRIRTGKHPKDRGDDLDRRSRRRGLRALVARRQGTLVPGPRGGWARHIGVAREDLGIGRHMMRADFGELGQALRFEPGEKTREPRRRRRRVCSGCGYAR